MAHQSISWVAARALLVTLSACTATSSEFSLPPPAAQPQPTPTPTPTATVPTTSVEDALTQVPGSIASLYQLSLSTDHQELTIDPAPVAVRSVRDRKPGGFSAHDSAAGGKVITLEGGPFRHGGWVRASLRQRVAGAAELESLGRAGYDLDQQRDLLVVDGEADPAQTVFAFSADRAKLGVVGICTGVTMLDFGKPERPIAVRKPVIYLHPAKTQRVQVRLELDGELTAAYPTPGPEGWDVIAAPDGTLIDRTTGRRSNYLFWEGTARDFRIDPTRAHCVAGDETVPFLEDACARFTLSQTECTDFITYWLPSMVGNPYNLIEFVDQDVYGRYARLNIEPVPDAVIRSFMVFARVESPVPVGAPALPQRNRGAFTVIEWGGADLSAPSPGR